MEVSFTDVFRRFNATSKVRLSDLGVRKQVTNCCLPFKSCKSKNTLRSMYITKIRYFQVKKEETK